MDEVDPKVMADIREHVSLLAERDFPRVWVGRPGITPEELLTIQEMNDEGPEWMRIEPGRDPVVGDLVPDVSTDWIEGPTALALIPDHFVEGELGNLQDEIGVIRAAKQGAVWVDIACRVKFATGGELDRLSEDDRISITGASFGEVGTAATIFDGHTVRTIPLDELRGVDVDEGLLEKLEFYASGETWGPYVVEDTPQARVLVEMRLQG
jgi:hypothetical protein